MRIKILCMFIALLNLSSLAAKDISVRYRDHDLNIAFTKEFIKVSGDQINMTLMPKNCNRSIFQSVQKELNAINERVDSQAFKSKINIENIIISTDKTKKEKIASNSELGARVLALRGYLTNMQFQENEVCKKP